MEVVDPNCTNMILPSAKGQKVRLDEVGLDRAPDMALGRRMAKWAIQMLLEQIRGIPDPANFNEIPDPDQFSSSCNPWIWS